jgi:hypothetical protein
MALGNLQTGAYKNVTATGNISPTHGALIGFYVNSTTDGTVQLYDSATTEDDVAITGEIKPAAGWHALPVTVGSGIYAVITGTIDVTFVFA